LTGKPDERVQKAIAAWAADLACPACHGALRFETERVACTACGRVYPVDDGIPVLIIERATMPA